MLAEAFMTMGDVWPAMLGVFRSQKSNSTALVNGMSLLGNLLRYCPNSNARDWAWMAATTAEPQLLSCTTPGMVMRYLRPDVVPWTNYNWKVPMRAYVQVMLDDLLVPFMCSPAYGAPPILSSISRAGTQTLRTRVLLRDGGKCLVSNLWSSHARAADLPRGEHVVGAQIAHIVPFKLNNKNDFHVAAERWCGIPRDTFRGDAINDIGNLLLLQSDVHIAMDDGRWGIEFLDQYTCLFRCIEPRPVRFHATRDLADGQPIFFGRGDPTRLQPGPSRAATSLAYGIARVWWDSGVSIANAEF